MTTTFEEREQAARLRREAAFDRAAEFREHHTRFRAAYDTEMRRLVSSLVAGAESILEVGAGLGDLIANLPAARRVGIDVSPAMVERARQRHPGLTFHTRDVERDDLADLGTFDAIVLSDVVGLLSDVEEALTQLGPLLSPTGRLIITAHSWAWQPVLRASEALNLTTHYPEQNWLSPSDLVNLLELAGFEVVREATDMLLPAPFTPKLINRVASKLPFLRGAALVPYWVAKYRPERLRPVEPLPSVSVICPCRNEAGNIADAIARTPLMGCATELLFVDGNSNDGTVEAIEAAIASYRGPLTLRLIHQGEGRGKGDAVRKGFAAATGDVLMILDSDLTVAPEDLPKFYNALVRNIGEFINGVRLVYPMEGEAMRFLNLLGNKFFSAALTWVLEQPIKDSLCGTKVLYRRDYERIAKNRDFFGDFDPFGDFDLLFGAARLNLKIVDLPIRYRARTYGDTKISRFTHGWLLLKMTAFGFQKLRL